MDMCKWIVFVRVKEFFLIERFKVSVKMATVTGKNKLKMGNGGRYYGAYLIYDMANSYLSALHAKIPATGATRTNPPSPVHVQNPRKFILHWEFYHFYYFLYRTSLLCQICRDLSLHFQRIFSQVHLTFSFVLFFTSRTVLQNKDNLLETMYFDRK